MRNTNIIMTKHIIHPAILFMTLMLCPTLGWAEGIKLLHGPYLDMLQEDNATIVWVADKPSVGWVEVAPYDGTDFYSVARPKFHDTNIGIKRTSLIHSVKLTNLKPGTRYRYRVYAQEVLSHKGAKVRYGDVVATDVYNKKPLCFQTNDRRQTETSFLVLNDIHERNDVLEKLLKNSSYKDKDMIFYAGDMISHVTHDTTVFKGFMDTSIKLFAQQKSWYYVRGNHETRGEWANRFHEYFCTQQPHLYFTVRQGPILFICLDTGEDKADTDIEYAGITDYDNYRTEQARWLKEVVASNEFKEAKYRVVIAHMPPADTQDAWHGQREVTKKLLPPLNKAGINLMICGHMHEHQYIEPNDSHDYPILVNSNNSSVTAQTKNGQLDVKVLDLNGKTTFHKTYSAR